MPDWKSDFVKTLISKERIANRIRELAKEIKRDFPSGVFCVVVLNGALVFFSSLMKELHTLGVPVSFVCVKISSYRGKKSSGKVKLELDAPIPSKNNVLIVEDIVDTGLTLQFLKGHLKRKKIPSVKVCSLLSKPNKHVEKLDYLGFEIPDQFVVGCGLDYNEKFRDLPFIAVLD